MPSKKSNCVDCNSLCSPGHPGCIICYRIYIKRAINYCIDCNKIITKKSKRCVSCSNKHNGKGVRKNYCIGCGIKITDYRSKRCPSCSCKGKRNGQWKGDSVGYVAVHDWVKRYKPKPEFCEDCGGAKPYDLANISGEYKRDVDDFEWLCRSCHMKKDDRLKKLLKNGTESRIRKKDGDLFQCKKCKKFKKKSLFNINKHSMDGLEYSCRECYKQINKVKNQRNRVRAIKIKIVKCFRCKSKDGVVSQYAKLFCKECAPIFDKESKKEISKKIEEIF